MEPFLSQDDHVLTFNWVRPRVGDVVVFKVGNNYLVKRIAKVSSGEVTVKGDHQALSSKVAPINKSQIAGKVVLRY